MNTPLEEEAVRYAFDSLEHDYNETSHGDNREERGFVTVKFKHRLERDPRYRLEVEIKISRAADDYTYTFCVVILQRPGAFDIIQHELNDKLARLQTLPFYSTTPLSDLA